MDLQHPSIRYFSIPNGFKSRNYGMLAKLKKSGLKAGIPDLCIPALGLWVEMKRQKGGVLSPEQKDWVYYLEEHCQQKVIVANGCADAIKQFNDYLEKISV